MKRILVLVISIIVCSCGEPPLQFSQEALNEKLVTLEGSETTLNTILESYKGKTLLIDVWASWCADCIKGLPKVKELQSEFTDVEFVFLSVDRGEDRWRRSITKYNITGNHYFLPEGQKGTFGDFLNSNWIPRYMIIGKEGNIKLFKAKKASDERIVEALK